MIASLSEECQTKSNSRYRSFSRSESKADIKAGKRLPPIDASRSSIYGDHALVI